MTNGRVVPGGRLPYALRCHTNKHANAKHTATQTHTARPAITAQRERVSATRDRGCGGGAPAKANLCLNAAATNAQPTRHTANVELNYYATNHCAIGANDARQQRPIT